MDAMTRMRIIGALVFVYGAVMLALLATPARGWALDHSIAEIVSWTDRRVDDQIHGSVDLPLAIVGSVVVMFAGVWFAVLIPAMFGRQRANLPRRMPATMPNPADTTRAATEPTKPRVDG